MLEQAYYIAELVGVVAIVCSLIFVGVQMRQNNRVTMSATRHSLSEHALQLISFQATHADRMARAMREPNLEPGDALFLENVFRMTFQLAENYHTQFKLGLMPEEHWTGFAKFIEDMLQGRRAVEFWQRYNGHYGGDFATWVDGLITPKEPKEKV
jgi:hypothetical protein